MHCINFPILHSLFCIYYIVKECANTQEKWVSLTLTYTIGKSPKLRYIAWWYANTIIASNTEKSFSFCQIVDTCQWYMYSNVVCYACLYFICYFRGYFGMPCYRLYHLKPHSPSIYSLRYRLEASFEHLTYQECHYIFFFFLLHIFCLRLFSLIEKFFAV